MARRKLYPIPVETLIDSADFAALPAAGAGMLFRLLLHYWLTNCRPLPRADHELQAIARAHKATWRACKPQILSIFSEIQPALDAYHAKRTRDAASLKQAGLNGAQARGATLRLAAWRKKIAASETVSPMPRRVDPVAAPQAPIAPDASLWIDR